MRDSSGVHFEPQQDQLEHRAPVARDIKKTCSPAEIRKTKRKVGPSFREGFGLIRQIGQFFQHEVGFSELQNGLEIQTVLIEFSCDEI